MHAIYKYHLDLANDYKECKIEMPVGAKILHLATLNNEPHIYAKVDSRTISNEERYFMAVFTGEEHLYLDDNDSTYIGTYNTLRGSINLVVHVFEY